MNNELLKEFLIKSEYTKPKICVIGDLIIDEYYDCIVNRLSPEASVPVILTNTSRPSIVKAGGAGNVASQIAMFTNCTFFCFKQNGIEISEPFQLYSYPIEQSPIKRRFRDEVGLHPRWDIETLNYGSNIDKQKADLLNDFKNYITSQNVSCVVLSDYGKGIFDACLAQEIIKICNKFNVTTIVDPKSHPLEMWKECKIFKPNKNEAELLTDTEDKHLHAKKIKERINCEYVIITNKGYGFYGDAELNTESDHKLKFTSGGGDIFAAILAISHSIGFNIQQSSEIAFEVGRLYVKNNTSNDFISHHTLKQYLNPISSKITDIIEFNNNKPSGKTIMVNGCFDAGLTLGHVKCLRYAKSKGDKLIIAINSDQSIKQIKGNNRPILPLEERMEILASLECVDYIIPFNELTPLNLIKSLKPDLLIKGGDYSKEQVVGYGIVPVEVTPLFDCISTTSKIQKLNNL